VIQLHFPFDVPIEDYILKGEVVLTEHFLVEVWVFLCKFGFDVVEFLHEFELVDVKWRTFGVLFQEKDLLVFVDLVMGNMLYD
jgi:hypothetical protein